MNNCISSIRNLVSARGAVRARLGFFLAISIIIAGSSALTPVSVRAQARTAVAANLEADTTEIEGAADESEAVTMESEESPALPSDLPGENGYHFVRPSQSLYAIAGMYGMKLSDIMRLNSISDPNLLHAGQKLRISVRAPAIKDDDDENRKPYPAAEIHIVQPGETVRMIASEYGMEMEDLMLVNGLPHEQLIHAGQRLRIQPILPRSIINMHAAPEDGKRWIEVDISDQSLTAWQGDVAVMQTVVSTGKASTPTVRGEFTINRKYAKQRMVGEDYDFPGVPSVMYFYSGFAIHGAYWEPPFGTPSTHGCVNVRPSEAAILYEWANTGTEVWVHE